MSIRVSHVLFDCDGTLFDTEVLKARSWGAAVVSLLDLESEIMGFYSAGSTTREVAAEVLRRCREEFGAHVGRMCSDLDIDTLIGRRVQEKDRLFDEAFPHEQDASASGRQLVRTEVWRLAVEAKENCPVGLVTTTQEHWVSRYFAASQPLDARGNPVTTPSAFFDPVVCGNKKGDGIMEAVCKALRVPDYKNVAKDERSGFVIFEDSLEGVREAKAVGIRVVAVPNEFTIDAALAADADACFPQEDLPGISFEQIVSRLR